MRLNGIILRAAIVLVLVFVCRIATIAQARGPQPENYAIFVSQRNGAAELYLLDLNTRQVSQLTDTGRGHLSASISPATQAIVFSAREGASYELFRGKFEIWLYSRMTEAVRQLTTDAAVVGGLGWSADSKQIAFTTAATQSKLSGIALADANTGSYRVLTDGNDFNASIAARGDRILFTSMRDGDAELYILDVNAGNVVRLTNGEV